MISKQGFEFTFEGGVRADGQMEQVLRELMVLLVKHNVRCTIDTFIDSEMVDGKFVPTFEDHGTFDLLSFEGGVLKARNVDHDYEQGSHEEWLATTEKLATAKRTGDWSEFDKEIPLAKINRVVCW